MTCKTAKPLQGRREIRVMTAVTTGLAGLPLLAILRHDYLRYAARCAQGAHVSSIRQKMSPDDHAGAVGRTSEDLCCILRSGPIDQPQVPQRLRQAVLDEVDD